MRKWKDGAFALLVLSLTMLALSALLFVIYFIVREALPTFQEVTLREFLFGRVWMPIAYTGKTSFGIFHFIMGTLYVSLLALALALFFSLGTALFLSCTASDRLRGICLPFIDLLAGIPSVIYGFVGLVVLVRLFIKAGVHTGSCVLAAGIVLAVMLLPYLISACCETMLKMKQRYMIAASAMGIDSWYAMAAIVLPASGRYILLNSVLAIGRAMGETMAVMMVMGNANLFPTLLGKGETIASVIALEMGTAVAGSTHYHALYAASLVLMVLLFLIDFGMSLLQHHWEKKGV